MKMNKILLFIFLLLGLSVGVNAESIVIEVGTVPPAAFAFAGSSPYWVAQDFTILNGTQTVSSMDIFLEDRGSYTADVVIRIETNNGGVPSGTLVDAGATLNIDDSEISNPGGVILKNFTSSFSLTNGTKYFLVTHMVWENSGDKTGVGVDTTNTYPDGSRWTSTNSGSSWSESATQDLVFTLFAEDANVTPVLAFTSITADNVTLINNTFYNGSIQFQTTVLNTSTNDLVNHSYSLDGAGLVQYATNNLNSSVNLNLTEGSYNISFFAQNNETNVTSSIFSFIVDLTPPTIDVLLPLTTDSYEVNFSNVVNVTDNLSGLASCTINITYLTSVEPDSDFFINCTDTQTFTRAGFYEGFLQTEDNAGNAATLLANGTINPVISVFFNSTNGTEVTNYSATVTDPLGDISQLLLNTNNPVNLTPIVNGTLIEGDYTIQFDKLGFATQNFTVAVNSTNAGINLTFNVTPSEIVVRIFDRETNTLLTGLTTITLQATIGFNGTTTTGLINITDINFISEQYQILAEHAGYDTETVYFNYNNQELINVDIFMLNTTQPEAGRINIIVKNSLSQFVESAVCSALEWRPSESAFVSVAQGLSNVIGETRLNIQLNTVIYKFSCTKDSFTTITNAQIIQIDDSSLTIILNDIILAPTPLFPNLVTSLTNTTLNATHQLITYNFADSDGLTTEACLRVFLVNGNRQTFDTENCVSSATGTILLTVDTNTSSNVLIQGTLTTPDVVNFVTDSLTIKGTGNLAGQLAKIGLDILLPTMFMLLGLGLGILLSKIEIAVVFMVIASWMSVAFVPTILKSSIAMFITVVVAMMLWGGFNRK